MQFQPILADFNLFLVSMSTPSEYLIALREDPPDTIPGPLLVGYGVQSIFCQYRRTVHQLLPMHYIEFSVDLTNVSWGDLHATPTCPCSGVEQTLLFSMLERKQQDFSR